MRVEKKQSTNGFQQKLNTFKVFLKARVPSLTMTLDWQIGYSKLNGTVMKFDCFVHCRIAKISICFFMATSKEIYFAIFKILMKMFVWTNVCFLILGSTEFRDGKKLVKALNIHLRKLWTILFKSTTFTAHILIL